MRSSRSCWKNQDSNKKATGLGEVGSRLVMQPHPVLTSAAYGWALMLSKFLEQFSRIQLVKHGHIHQCGVAGKCRTEGRD
ncbi:MAG: hypothetical protein ACLTSZ_13490 [Lachnospiraceae bacterium]